MDIENTNPNFINDHNNLNLNNNNMYIENSNQNLNMNNSNNNQLNDDGNAESEMSVATSQISRGSFLSNISNIKNNVMNKFKKNAYLWPLILFIVFGIVFFLFEKDQDYGRINIIIIFSIIMGLIILYNICLYFKDLRKFKKMAEDDRKKLLLSLSSHNIKIEDIADNIILLNNEIYSRIEEHHMNYEEYMKNVFPYLCEYLEKDGLRLYKEEGKENGNEKYWKEI